MFTQFLDKKKFKTHSLHIVLTTSLPHPEDGGDAQFPVLRNFGNQPDFKSGEQRCDY